MQAILITLLLLLLSILFFKTFHLKTPINANRKRSPCAPLGIPLRVRSAVGLDILAADESAWPHAAIVAEPVDKMRCCPGCSDWRHRQTTCRNQLIVSKNVGASSSHSGLETKQRRDLLRLLPATCLNELFNSNASNY